MSDNYPSYDRPIAGKKVLDLSQGIAGPYCGMLLDQYGADVIKLEPPWGDWARFLGVPTGDQNAVSITVNRGKRSIAVDLTKKEGRALALQMSKSCDVFIESFRPGVAARLGVDYEAVRAVNQKVIYLSISGFGQRGPAKHSPSSDSVMQAFSGMMIVNQDTTGAPKSTGFLTVDYVTALYAFVAVSMSLIANPFEPEGRHLDVSLAQATGAFLNMKLIQAQCEGQAPKKINAPAGIYETDDGWISITLVKDKEFDYICEAIGRPDLAEDPRFYGFENRSDNEEALLTELRQAFIQRPTDYWLKRCKATGVLCSPVNSLTDWLDDKHVREAGLVVEEKVPGMPPFPWVPLPGAVHPDPEDARSRWPSIGQHGLEILTEMGLRRDEIDGLVAKQVLALPSPENS